MKKLLSFILLFIWAVSLFAIPANRKPSVVKQSDGTMLSVILKGDEAMSFYTTLDGKYIVREYNGDFCYATFSSEGGFVSTGVIAHDKEKRNDVENELLSGMDYNAMKVAVSKTHKLRSAKYRGTAATRAASSSIVPKGEVLVPVLLVQYKDVKFSYTKEDINKLLNEEGYKYNFSPGGVESYGSARDYFIAQSDSLFFPKFVVTDILTLPNEMSYYGGNDSYGNDNNPQKMISDGIDLADKTGLDFSQFDNDKNGEVEFIYCIYAGYAEANQASVNTIWPHKWELSSDIGKKKVDGVYCDTYACSSELYMNEGLETEYGKWLSGIGTICHEFSHCLGLADIYDVNGESGNFCMNEWDLMDYGNFVGEGYIPVGYNSYQKDVCGWKELVTLDKKGKYSMLPQTQDGVGYKIINDANPNEYFVLENRKREGWDQMLPADGMMIVHVDYNKSAWDNNTVNVTNGHPRFQIVPADNDLLLYSGANEEQYYNSLANDLWPGKNNNTEFTDVSLPAAKLFTGSKLNKPVTNIKYENYVASFTFMGGIETPVVLPATDVTKDSFVANWARIDDATGYSVELYKVENVTVGEGDVATLVNEDFLKCVKSNFEIVESEVDTYISAGWTGNRIYSENGLLHIGTSANIGVLTTPKLNATGDVSISLKVNKYNSKDSGFEFIVDVLDAVGEKIASEVVTTAGKVNLSAYVDGDFYVRFSTGAGAEKKRVLVDDIVISVAVPYKKILLGEVETSENYFVFNELEEGEYLYRVKATDGNDESSYSDFVKVVLTSTDITDVRFDDGNVVVYSVTGVKVYEGDFKAFKAAARGIYIVKSSAGTAKIKIE